MDHVEYILPAYGLALLAFVGLGVRAYVKLRHWAKRAGDD